MILDTVCDAWNMNMYDEHHGIYSWIPPPLKTVLLDISMMSWTLPEINGKPPLSSSCPLLQTGESFFESRGDAASECELQSFEMWTGPHQSFQQPDRQLGVWIPQSPAAFHQVSRHVCGCGQTCLTLRWDQLSKHSVLCLRGWMASRIRGGQSAGSVRHTNAVSTRDGSSEHKMEDVHTSWVNVSCLRRQLWWLN